MKLEGSNPSRPLDAKHASRNLRCQPQKTFSVVALWQSTVLAAEEVGSIPALGAQLYGILFMLNMV